MTDRNEVTLSFTDDGIFSSVGESIQWLRDDQGRITEIIDPAGNSILYQYTAAGDLLSVTDQVANTWTMSYLSEPVHYLAAMTDPRGVETLSLEYDDDGRLVATGDALGNQVTQSYDLPNNTEIVGDRLGNETSLVFDDRGNITSITDPLGNVTGITYDAADNQTSITDPRGFTSHAEYDSQGNVTRATDAEGHVWQSAYNDRNDIVTATDPLGPHGQPLLRRGR